MDYCRNCGKELLDGATFCVWCGTRNEPEPAQSAPVQAEPLQGELPETAPAEVYEAPAQEPAVYSMGTVGPSAEPAPVTPETHAETAGKPVKEQKYYTIGHIAMCLCAVGVMAIIAGVFAGLYFSVI